MSMMKRQVIRWATGICMGLIIGSIIYLALYRSYFSPLAKQGQRAGYDVPTYVEVHTLEEKADKQKQLSPSEVDRIAILSNDANPGIRMRALTALFYIGETGLAERAANIARAKLNDFDPGVRQYALSALDHLKTADIKAVAKTMLNDSAENVRTKARRILERP